MVRSNLCFSEDKQWLSMGVDNYPFPQAINVILWHAVGNLEVGTLEHNGMPLWNCTPRINFRNLND